MADFSSLKATIQSYIKQNGNEAITGNVLQDVLLAMVQTMGDGAINSLASNLNTEILDRQNGDSTLQGNINTISSAVTALQDSVTVINGRLAEGYLYIGIANASTNPGTPQGKVFYLALNAGTYSHFGNIQLSKGVNILKYNGSSWSGEQLVAIDENPVAGSHALIESGAVFAGMFFEKDMDITWMDHKYYVEQDGKAVLNSHSGSVEAASIDVSNMTGTTLYINSLSVVSTWLTKNLFVDNENNIIEDISHTTSNNPAYHVVPVGAKKLLLTNVYGWNEDSPFVKYTSNIKDALEELEKECKYKKKLDISWTPRKFATVENDQLNFLNNNLWNLGMVDVSLYKGKYVFINCIAKSEDNPYSVVHAFVDVNNNLISPAFTIKPSDNPLEVKVPRNADRLYLSNQVGYNPDPTVTIYGTVQDLADEVENMDDKNYVRSQWVGKRILWLGTSIPWGQTDEDHPGTTHRSDNPYPKQVCEAYGATLIDSTHGGLAQMAMYDQATGLWYPRLYSGTTSSGGSTCLTVAECQAAYQAGLVDSDLSALSYERTLLGKDADLYIFDVEPNNDDIGSADTLALFDWYQWKYTDDSTFASHRDTYIGALIYEIDQLLTEKPNAIIVFVGEYLYMKASDYSYNYGVRTQSKALCEKFHIHYIDLAEKLFYVGKNKSQWINTDMVHPKQASYDRMAKILIHELLMIA